MRKIEHLLPFIWDSFSQKTLSLLVIVVSPTKTYSLLHFLGYKTFWREVYKTSTLKMENFWGNIFVGRELFSSEVKEEMISIEAAVENRCGQKIANQSSLRNCCGSWKSLWSLKTLNFKTHLCLIRHLILGRGWQVVSKCVSWRWSFAHIEIKFGFILW